nr:MAG TPA: hypothetical protein [Caudoviricetes sp.]
MHIIIINTFFRTCLITYCECSIQRSVVRWYKKIAISNSVPIRQISNCRIQSTFQIFNCHSGIQISSNFKCIAI